MLINHKKMNKNVTFDIEIADKKTLESNVNPTDEFTFDVLKSIT